MAFEIFQQFHLVGIRKARQGVLRQIQFAAAGPGHDLRCALLTPARDRASGLRRGFQRGQTDVVGVGERRLLAADRAYADALIDVEAAGLHHPLFEAPALRARILEVQISVVDAVGHDLAEYALNPAGVETVRCKQRAVCRREQQLVIVCRIVGHRN